MSMGGSAEQAGKGHTRRHTPTGTESTSVAGKCLTQHYLGVKKD